MEIIRKRKLKFRCLFGGNDETPSRRFVQSSSPANPTTELKFEVGKSSSKQSNGNQMKKLLPKGILNGISSKKRSPSILAKLVGRGRHTSKNVEIVDRSSDKRGKNKELVCNGITCELRGAKETVPKISSKVKEDFKSGHVDYYGYDESLCVLRSDSVSESEEITVSSRIIIDRHDRLTHSVSHMSESSLIREATNIMFERWSITDINEDEVDTFSDKETKPKESGSVMGLVAVSDVFASPTGLGSLLATSSRDDQGDMHLKSTSFSDPNSKRNVGHEDDDDVDEKVYRESSNQVRRKVQKDVFNHKEDMHLKSVRSNKRFQSSHKLNGTYFKNEDPAEYQPSSSDVDVDALLSGPESEDVAIASDDLESINSRLQDLKKNIHQLTVESKVISAKVRLIPKVKHIGQLSSAAIPESVSPESAYMPHILQTLENYATSDQTIHHPIDPMLFGCLEEYYYEGKALLTWERVFYDYVEQMLIRNSKSTVVYPWVNPVKRESQLRLPIEDQIRNVVVEIEKAQNEDFCEIYYDKDSEWMQPTSDIDILGMLIAELVLDDLLLEVIDL